MLSQVELDKIKESFEHRAIKNDEKYLQYLSDNNLQHTYVPTIGNISIFLTIFAKVLILFSKISINISVFLSFSRFTNILKKFVVRNQYESNSSIVEHDTDFKRQNTKLVFCKDYMNSQYFLYYIYSQSKTTKSCN